MSILPYLSFDGRCEEAIEFYKKALGAEVQMLMRFKDNPDSASCGNMPPGTAEKVMHATLSVGGATFFASDGRCQGPAKFEGISLSCTVADETQAARAFNGLADGGTITMPLAKTFFSPAFGMLKDRFGVTWMIYVAQ